MDFTSSPTFSVSMSLSHQLIQILHHWIKNCCWVNLLWLESSLSNKGLHNESAFSSDFFFNMTEKPTLLVSLGTTGVLWVSDYDALDPKQNYTSPQNPNLTKSFLSGTAATFFKQHEIYICVCVLQGQRLEVQSPLRKLLVGPSTLRNHFNDNGFCNVIFYRYYRQFI